MSTTVPGTNPLGMASTGLPVDHYTHVVDVVITVNATSDPLGRAIAIALASNQWRGHCAHDRRHDRHAGREGTHVAASFVDGDARRLADWVTHLTRWQPAIVSVCGRDLQANPPREEAPP